jgi:hypothetical protein
MRDTMRKKTLLAAAAVLSLSAVGLSAPAPAAAPGFNQHLTGSEIRRSTTHGDEYREEVLHLHGNGRLTGNFQVTRSNLPGGGVELRQGHIQGRWTQNGKQLCLAGSGLSEGPQSCYNLAKSYSGKRQYAAVNVHTGEIWQVFIYPNEVR